ncbi:MAG: AsmA family protein, partial [Candidatus Latescibacterota bacterium]
MRGRFWIPFIILAALLLVGGYVAAFHILHIEQRARNYIIRRVASELGADFEISSLSISPWFIGFRDVRLSLKNLPLTVEAKRIRIGFDLTALIRNRFRPAEGVEQIFVEYPKFIWSSGAADSSMQNLWTKSAIVIPIQKLPSMFIDFSNGSFFLENSGALTKIAGNVAGWMDGRAGQSGEIKLEGEILSATRNARCTGVFRRDRETAVFDIEVKSCDLARDELKPLLKRITVPSGKLDASFHLEQREQKLNWGGAFQLAGCSFRLRDSIFGMDDITASGSFGNSEIRFDTLSGRIWGVTPRMKGSLRLLPKPYLELAAEMENVSVADLFAEISPGLKKHPEGKVNAEFRITGPLDSFTVEALFSSGMIAYRNERCDQVSVKVHAEPDRIRIERAVATVRGYRVSIDGVVSGGLNARKRNLLISAGAKEIGANGKEYRIKLQGTADPRDRSMTAEYDFAHQNDSDPVPGHLSGMVSLTKDELGFSCLNTFASVTGRITNLFSKPYTRSRITLTRFPVMKYSGGEDGGPLLNGTVDVSGTAERLTCDGSIGLSGQHDLKAMLTGKADISAPFRPSRKITANIRISDFRILHSAPHAFDASLHSDSTFTLATVTDDAGSAQMLVRAMRHQGGLSGYLHLRSYPMEQIIAIFKDDDFNYHGRLTGSLQLGGTVQKPLFFSPQPIQVDSLNIDTLDRLSGSGFVSGRLGELKFDRV